MKTLLEHVRQRAPLLIALASFFFAASLSFVGWFHEWFRFDDGLAAPRVLDSGAFVVAIMTGLLALHRQFVGELAPPAGVVSETRRTWQMMALAALIGFGPAAGYTAGVLYDANTGTGDALAATCAVQEHILAEEGELSTAVAELRLHGTVSADACAEAGPVNGADWTLRSVRGVYHFEDEASAFSGGAHSAYVRGEIASSVAGWSLDRRHTREHAAHLAAQSWSPDSGVRSALMSPLQIGFAHVLLAVGIVWLVGSFPIFRRVPLAPQTPTARLVRTLVVGVLCGMGVREFSAWSVEDIMVWWAGIPLAVSLALIASSRFRRILHLVWPAAILLIFAEIFSGTLPRPHRIYQHDVETPLLFVSVALLAAAVVLTPLYAAINERIRVLPE